MRQATFRLIPCGILDVKACLQLVFGDSALQVLGTPGHTGGCVTYYSPQDGGLAFTGDALMIQGCGRTDFQEGDARSHLAYHCIVNWLQVQLALHLAPCLHCACCNNSWG